MHEAVLAEIKTKRLKLWKKKDLKSVPAGRASRTKKRLRVNHKKLYINSTL